MTIPRGGGQRYCLDVGTGEVREVDVDRVDGVEVAVHESLPDDVVAGLEVWDAWRRELAARAAGLEFIVSDISERPWVM